MLGRITKSWRRKTILKILFGKLSRGLQDAICFLFAMVYMNSQTLIGI